MKTETFHLDLITPCFCAGANQAVAEIRPASIRGQLRWWFRTLGGFTSLAPMPVPQQEAMIFGSIAGGEGMAGYLTVRIRSTGLVSSVRDGQELGHPNFSEPAYLTFPIQSREKNGQKKYNGRGVFTSGSFELLPIWKGQPGLWEDIRALVAMFGHLGALGFRGRRAMGALGFSGRPPLELVEARSHFFSPDAILIKQLPAESAKDAVSVLGSWLKSCRSHGRSSDHNRKELESPFFKFAEVDHDIGYDIQHTKGKPSFRPALGLPIIQRTNNGTNNWDFGTGNTKGRFASPVLLRPHRDTQGNWHALVIFVDAHKWPTGKPVYLNGQERKVSLDLYEAMKKDERLQDFLG